MTDSSHGSPPQSAQIRVLIADDDVLAKRTVAAYLDRDPTVTVVAICATADEALTQLALTEVDVAVFDVRMPGIDGVEATRRALQVQPATRVLLTTSFDDQELLFASLKAGAHGLIAKSASSAEYRSAVAAVAVGLLVFTESTWRRPVNRTESKPATVAPLTPIEREVLTLLCRGLSNAEIAAELYRSESSIKAHLGKLMDKLGATSRLQLVIRAHELGMERDFTT